MEEKMIILNKRVQRLMADYSLTENEERRLLELLAEGRRKWKEKREPSTATTESKSGMKYISCPYTDAERKRIMKWVCEHDTDVKGLAVALWLSGGIAPQEIINLRAKDYGNVDGDMGFGRKGCAEWNREGIIRRALNLHPEGLEFAFMFPKGAEWKKLDGSSIQMRLYNICDMVGITYKSFHKNEAIAFDERQKNSIFF